MSFHSKLILFGLSFSAATVMAATPASKTSAKKPVAKAVATPAPTPAQKPIAPPPGPALPPGFGIFEVADQPSPNSVPLKTPNGKETLNVDLMPVLAPDSYQSASATSGGVSIEFSKNGSRVFHNYTVSHIGKRIALAINGRLISAPVIKEAIDNKIVAVGATGKDASEIVSSVNNKPKTAAPAPLPSATPKGAVPAKK